MAVGDVLRRTFERAVWERSRPAITAALLPQQLGVGLPSGCQKQIWIAHLLQEMASLGAEDENGDFSRFANWVFVKLDQKNAHNSYKRAAAQRALDAIPKASAFARVHYATNVHAPALISHIHGKAVKVCESIEGGQQGSPLVPPAYGAVLDPILKNLDSKLGDDGLVRAIQDDILVVGEPAQVFAHLGSLIEELKEIGGELAQGRGKNSIYRPRGPLEESSFPDYLTQSYHEDTEGNKSYGFELCGAGIGCPGYIHHHLRGKVDKIKDMVNEHSELMSNRDAQVSHALNRLSWQMKPDYLLATHTPADTQPFIAELDELTHQAAKRGLGIDLASPDGPDPGGRLDAHFSFFLIVVARRPPFSIINTHISNAPLPYSVPTPPWPRL